MHEPKRSVSIRAVEQCQVDAHDRHTGIVRRACEVTGGSKPWGVVSCGERAVGEPCAATSSTHSERTIERGPGSETVGGDGASYG